MGDKNEGIFLWLLEQDRQANRVRSSKERTSKSMEQLSSATRSLILNSESSQEHKDKRPQASETANFEHLIEEKASLEGELHRLYEEQKRVHVRLKTVCALVQELKKRNGEEKQEVNQGQTKTGRFVAQFRELPFSNAAEENESGNSDNKPNKSASDVSQEKLLDSDQDGVKVEIIEEIE